MMIATLLDGLNTSALSGPISEKDAHTISIFHHSGIFSELKKPSPDGVHFADLARKRIWDKQWTPDPLLLASFPRRTSVLRQSLIDFITDALQFGSMDSREHAISEPFEQTYNWVFDLDPRLSSEGVQMWPSFPKWLEDKSAAPYWITGKPGSGKSTMMKFIMNSPTLDRHLQKWSTGGLVHKIRYYAWKPGQKLDKSKEGLMRTLLYQMIAADPGLTPYLFPRRWTLFHMIRTVESEYFPPWDTWELEESIYRLADHSGGSSCRLILMIDGLDEFDEAPAEICTMLQRIGSHESIKVCAASRPWPQFMDTFANSPQMQMHDVTRPAMSTFVDGHFRGEPAFQTLNRVYSNGGDRLLSELVEKSQGVFLWLSLVSRMILGAMVNGESLVELQRILGSLPSEIKTLYDAMFATIPEALHQSTSVILQLCATPATPIHWLTLWLADELREAPSTMELTRDNFDIDAAKTVLKRRLSARTRGILEVVDHNGTVVYLHRSVAEWMEKKEVWKLVNDWNPPNFDPHYCLAGAETILLGWEEPRLSSLWAIAGRALSYASQIDQNRTSDEAITAILDQLDVSVRSKVTYPPKPSSQANGAIALATFQSDSLLVKYHVPELAVQFAVLPYIRHRLKENTHHFSAEPPSEMPWLEQAVMAPAITGYGLKSHWAFPDTNMEQRLQVIRTMLLHGGRSKGLVAQVKANKTRGADFAKEALDVLEGRRDPAAQTPVSRDPNSGDPVPQTRRKRDYFKLGFGRRH